MDDYLERNTAAEPRVEGMDKPGPRDDWRQPPGVVGLPDLRRHAAVAADFGTALVICSVGIERDVRAAVEGLDVEVYASVNPALAGDRTVTIYPPAQRPPGIPGSVRASTSIPGT